MRPTPTVRIALESHVTAVVAHHPVAAIVSSSRVFPFRSAPAIRLPSIIALRTPCPCDKNASSPIRTSNLPLRTAKVPIDKELRNGYTPPCGEERKGYVSLQLGSPRCPAFSPRKSATLLLSISSTLFKMTPPQPPDSTNFIHSSQNIGGCMQVLPKSELPSESRRRAGASYSRREGAIR